MTEEAQQGFGEELRLAREAAGLQISDLAATTRIGARYIAALEAEDWTVVPGAVIGRGFVRVLARELRTAPGPLEAAYRAARGEPQRLDHTLPEADWVVPLRKAHLLSSRPLLLGGGVVVVLLLVLAGGLWWWSPGPVSEAPPAAPVAAPASPVAVPLPAEPNAAAAVATPAAGEAVPAPAAVPAPDAAAAPEVAAAPAVAVGPHLLGIQAVEKVWVGVAVDGGKSQGRFLDPGERAEFTGDKEVKLRLGNAGSVRLTWDGDALRVPGKAGEVKTLEFPAAAAALRP